MRWWGPATRLERFDQADGILFRVTGQRRLGDLLLPLGSSIGFLIALWRNTGIGGLLGLAVLAIVGLIHWLRTSRTELHVTENDLRVAGDLDMSKTGSLRLTWPEISGLQFNHGGKHHPSGLYARQGAWSSTCILPHLDEEQAGEVIDAIYGCFPHLMMAEESSGFGSLFERRSEIITLGLSKEDH